MFERRLWGDISRLHYGKALRGYSTTPGPVRVFGTNGPIGYTSVAQSEGPGVIIGRKGAYRGVHFSKGPFWVIDTAFYINHASEIDTRWAYYALSGADINSLGSGSAIPSTTRDDFYAMSVLVPPLGEQLAIAEILGALDDKIAVNANLTTAAADLARALLKRRTPTKTLGDIVACHRNSVDPATLSDDTVAHFSLPAFDTGQRPEIVAPAEIKSTKFLIQRPCVLVSKLNPRFPRIWDIPHVQHQPALASTEYLVLESKHSSSTVLWAILSHPSFSASLQAKVAGTSGSHQRVRPEDILATEVVDPRELEQVLQQQITDLGRRAALSRGESANLATIRDVLLPQLMSGKLQVKDAEKTAEEVL